MILRAKRLIFWDKINFARTLYGGIPIKRDKLIKDKFIKEAGTVF